MTLYHFTAERFVRPILANGLTIGALLVNERTIQLDRNYRWLTTNPAWDQSWAEGTGRLPYRRTEARLTIEVPTWATNRVLTWTISGPILSGAYKLLSELGDPENWRLFRGDLPPAWITGVEYPAPALPLPLTGSEAT